MNVSSMLNCVPLPNSSVEQSAGLIDWIWEWANKMSLKPLTECEWITKGHGLSDDICTNTDGMKFNSENDNSVLLWSLPPWLGSVALMYLWKSVHKRPDRNHVFVIPKIMTYSWRKIMLKTCDVLFCIGIRHPLWGQCMYGSLFVAVYLPLLQCYPWTYRRSLSVLALERKV